MGNCCGKSSDDGDNFAGAGRVLGSSNNNAQPSSGSRASVPNRPSKPVPDRKTKPKPKVTGPGRTVGGSGGTQDNVAGGSSGDDPRAAAGRAAQDRVQRSENKPRGKLGDQLAAQKKQTRAEALEQASKDNQASRDTDAAQQVRNYN